MGCIKNMVNRANRNLYMLETLKRSDLIVIYLGCIGPILEYATPVWNFNITDKHVQTLGNVQRRTSLKEPRKQFCLKFGRSLLNSQQLNSSWIPLTRKQSHSRQLRNSNAITAPFCSIKKYQNIPIVGLIK